MKTIFFDFGNVIAFFDHQRAVKQLERFTDMPPFELTLTLYGGPIEDDYECGKHTTEEYVRLGKLNGRLSCTTEEFLTAFVDIFWRNDEVCDLIPKLRPKYRLLLASNTNHAHFEKYTAQFANVLEHFDHLCVSHHIGHRKPHAEFFTYCQQHAGVPPEQCLFIDDMAVNVEAALKHGWNAICYRPNTGFADQLRAAGIQFG